MILVTEYTESTEMKDRKRKDRQDRKERQVQPPAFRSFEKECEKTEQSLGDSMADNFHSALFLRILFQSGRLRRPAAAGSGVFARNFYRRCAREVIPLSWSCFCDTRSNSIQGSVQRSAARTTVEATKGEQNRRSR